MTRVLLVETASPKRVRATAEAILAGDIYSNPQVTILCSSDPRTIEYFQEIPGIQVTTLNTKEAGRVRENPGERKFDVMRIFWTGEKKYRRMKMRAVTLPASHTDVDSGDGSVFRLTWRSFLRFWLFRLRHRLPSDHYIFVPPRADVEQEVYYQGEKILIVESAEPPHILRALEHLSERHLFRNPRYTLFCRNRPDVVGKLKAHPMISEVRTHTETQGSWEHLKHLRKERFDGVVVFFTGDPSYWKIKYFVFLLGARHKVIFNENNDCFLFAWSEWLSLLAHRLGERSRHGSGPRWFYQARLLLFLSIKGLLFPLRFIWLLLVWVRLRRFTIYD
jgi:hypothetical protein